MHQSIYFLFLCALLLEPCFAQRGDKGDQNQPDPPASLVIPPAPVLSPEQALESFQVMDGFRVEIVATEPLIQDPVAVRIDQDGRLWVVEMQSFMPDVDGHGEDAAISRIVILDDTDCDGRMDTSKVFMDQLVLPRALQFVQGGVLYADQEKLYFVPVGENDQAGEPVVIDKNYSGGGNVEHKANGLLRGLDNWLYNAKSSSRYRFIDGVWVETKTEARGQWGISQDDYGRLYYNGNSSNVYGDWVPASMMMRNANIDKKRWDGSNQPIVSDARVYPIRVTTGVNRGYQAGTLNDEFKLNKLTAACGPLIYRGSNFPDEFYGNAFTPAPCCNLIKRNVLTESDARVTGKQAYSDEEFLASTDERFRPVALENAPDGSLYMVDFYRGIIQHKTYVTSYLRRQIASRGLATPDGLGRIYRIVSTRADAPTPAKPNLSAESPQQWIAHLRNPNAWWRETAQRLLVDQGDPAVTTDLVKLCADNEHPLAQIHALWTLEGLGEIPIAALQAAATSANPKVLATAVRLSAQCADDCFPIVQAISSKSQHADVDLQLALLLGNSASPSALSLLEEVLLRRGKDDLFVDAALSGLENQEAALLSQLQNSTNHSAHQKIIAALQDITKPKVAKVAVPLITLTSSQKKQRAKGEVLYGQFCFACHGENGEGLTALAPPLANSEWVTGSPLRFAAIVLNGAKGPITVDGERYDVPQIQPLMPGLKDNPEYTDENLAAILTYTRTAFGNQAEPVSPKTIKEARAKFKDRDLFSEAELKEIP